MITVGDLDPLLDDSLFLFERWRAAGNSACLRVYPQAPHGFNRQQTAMAHRANVGMAAFLAGGLRSGWTG